MNEFSRKITVTFSVVLTLIGMGLSIGAIMTPSWQVVNLREYGSIHEHGLWLDCTRHSRDGTALLRRYATITEPLHCVYKFDYDKYSGTFDLEDDNSPVGEVNRHKFYGWHTATLILLALAMITAFISVCIGFCGCCYPSLSLVFTVTTLLTTFLSSVAVGLFFFFSHRADNRFIKGIVGTYEQRVGVAFFLQMASCFFHFLAFLVAMLFTYFSFSVKGGALDRYSIQQSSRTNMTNVGRGGAPFSPLLGQPPPSFRSGAGYDLAAQCPPSDCESVFRSMEFEHPVFTQNPAKGGIARPPYYTKSDVFDRAVADSMPELGQARSYQSDILPPRIRRKSETCV